MKRFNFLLIVALATLLLGCSQKPQFGKAPLHLDHFGLNLDVESFFADETLFRDNEKYTLKTEEESIKIDNTDSTLKYVRYSVVSSPTSDTLARYNNFNFGDLEVVMDFDDQKTFMVSAAQENVRPGAVDTLVKEITEEYGALIPPIKNDEPRYITYQWMKDGKLAKLVLNTENPLYDHNDSEQPQDVSKLFSEAYHKEQSINVSFFIVSPLFDHYLKSASSLSGLLSRYR